jgi:hypothetical protein
MKCNISVSLVSQREGASSRGCKLRRRRGGRKVCVFRGRLEGQEEEDMRCVAYGSVERSRGGG